MASEVCSNPSWNGYAPFALTRGSFSASATGFQAQSETVRIFHNGEFVEERENNPQHIETVYVSQPKD